MKEALTQLRKDGSRFDIIIIEQYLLGMYEFELLRICREIDLPVVGKLVQFLTYTTFFSLFYWDICYF